MQLSVADVGGATSNRSKLSVRFEPNVIRTTSERDDVGRPDFAVAWKLITQKLRPVPLLSAVAVPLE